MEGPDDLSEGELEVTMAPTAVTSVLFGLGTVSVPILHVKGGDTTSIAKGENTTDLYSIWAQQDLKSRGQRSLFTALLDWLRKDSDLELTCQRSLFTALLHC